MVERLTVSETTAPRALQQQVATLDRELANLVAIAAAGGDVAEVAAAIRSREAQRRALLERLHHPSDPSKFGSKTVLRDLQARLGEWRELLRDETPKARALLKQLIVGRIDMRPDEEGGIYRYSGSGTLLPLFEGLMVTL